MSSIDGTGGRTSAQTSRRANAPDAETNALLRERFAHHLVTQVKLSSVVSEASRALFLAVWLTAAARWRQMPLVLFLRSAGTSSVPGACGPRAWEGLARICQ
jgi:hypothetical protein